LYALVQEIFLLEGMDKMLEFEIDNTVLTAVITGELDQHTAGVLREQIDLKLATGIYNTLIFDFTNLSFMDSSGIALVMGRVKNMQAVSGNVKVRINDVKMAKILTMSGMDKYVEFI